MSILFTMPSTLILPLKGSKLIGEGSQLHRNAFSGKKREPSPFRRISACVPDGEDAEGHQEDQDDPAVGFLPDLAEEEMSGVSADGERCQGIKEQLPDLVRHQSRVGLGAHDHEAGEEIIALEGGLDQLLAPGLQGDIDDYRRARRAEGATETAGQEAG